MILQSLKGERKQDYKGVAIFDVRLSGNRPKMLTYVLLVRLQHDKWISLTEVIGKPIEKMVVDYKRLQVHWQQNHYKCQKDLNFYSFAFFKKSIKMHIKHTDTFNWCKHVRVGLVYKEETRKKKQWNCYIDKRPMGDNFHLRNIFQQ